VTYELQRATTRVAPTRNNSFIHWGRIVQEHGACDLRTTDLPKGRHSRHYFVPGRINATATDFALERSKLRHYNSPHRGEGSSLYFQHPVFHDDLVVYPQGRL
jgi:hypothetical protein